ncbi:MAG: hypothetical protein C0432_04190 [Candidatus Puniceispirillum sp.]|nr:hypothetical protein [Candidatus Pelagibacter sp.]MBA4283475.1 hypothetical protein [Candidatus Puniceispirillum sp.]
MAENDKKPIIYIKKVIKKADHGAHGGSWKIAYADFVTAMMAFFMLMWLVNVASDEQKSGIAEYFALNFINTNSQNGGAGMMQGINVSNSNNSDGKGTEPNPVENEESESPENTDTGMPSHIPDPNNKEVSSTEKGGENSYDVSRDSSKSSSQKSAEKIPQTNLDKGTILNQKVASQIQGQKESSNTQGPKNSNGETNTSGEQTHQGDATSNSGNKKNDISQGDKKTSTLNENMTSKEPQGPKDQNGLKQKDGEKELKDNDNKPDQVSNQGQPAQDGDQVSAGKSDKQTPTLTEAEKNMLKQILDAEHEKVILYSENRILRNKDLKNIHKDKLEKLYKEENENLEKLAHELLAKVSKDSETKKLLPNLVVELSSEGLKIQIIDQYKRAMFEKGSSQISEHTLKLLQKIGDIIKESTKKVVIAGHTDATPYSGTEYTNWELSADRANSTRKAFVKFGVSPQRFESVIGREASDPLITKDPYAPQNRRIGITLLRDVPSS